MIDPADILSQAIALRNQRGKRYGSVEENLTRAASIASHWLRKSVSARDVAIIMASIKISRISETPDHADSWVDLCNYAAFGAALSSPDATIPTGGGTADAVSSLVNGNGA